ncbi:MAG: hypothetical protein FJ279_24845 [Planctomycetes bacterium]|nr:hypothetical protein [Planctomycetota bacterium]
MAGTDTSGVQEIVAQPKALAQRRWLLLVHPWLLLAFCGYILFGVWGVALVSVLLGVEPRISQSFSRRLSYGRATLSPEGITLYPFVEGRFSVGPVTIKWADVVKVRKVSFGPSSPAPDLLIRIGPSWGFWSLRRPLLVPVPAALWQMPAFIEAIQKNVPEGNIRPGALDPSTPVGPAWVRPACACVLLICSIVVGASAILLVTRPEQWFLGCLMATSICIYVAWVATWIPRCMGTGSLLTVAEPIGAAMAPLIFMVWAVMAGMFGGGGLVSLLGAMGAISGLCLAAALLMVAARPGPKWRGAVLCYALGVLGLMAGWGGYDGIRDTKVALGSIEHANPWTPDGSGFLMLEKSPRVVDPDAPEQVRGWRWFSADLVPGHTAQAPGTARIALVGQDGALCVSDRLRGEGRELWHVPRHTGESKRLLSAHRFRNFRLSPSGGMAVACSEDPSEKRSWHVVDLKSGQLATPTLPPSHSDLAAIGVYDNGTLLLLKGAFPQNPIGKRVYATTPIPADGKFPYPGEPFTLWAWHPARSEPPVQIYAAKAQWLHWEADATFHRLFACQLVTQPTPHTEWILVDLSCEPPKELPADASSVEKRRRTSPDGRFLVETHGGHLGPMRISNRDMGKTRHLRSGGSLWCRYQPAWSPKGHTLLIETEELTRHPWGFHPFKALRIKTVVRLVDLDKEWPKS